MKVAILTLRLHTNYGGILQAYALMQVLKRLGHEPWLIFNQPFKYRPWYSEIRIYIIKAFRKFVLGDKTLEIFREKRIRKEYETIYENTLQFVEKYMQPRTDIICTSKEWNQLHRKYHFDAYVVGSDQVWRPAYAKPISRYFFSFLKKEKEVKRIAYAASFGVDKWTFSEKETKECQELIQLFDAISFREQSGVELCKRNLGRGGVHLLDPTMLLKKEDYISLSSFEKKEEAKGKIFVYILDQSEWKDRVVQNVEQKYNLFSFEVNRFAVAAPVEDWLNAFYTADYIVTDSFHACIFSILFHKPFYVCGNKERGLTRIYSLLKMFDLENRIIDRDTSFILSEQSIDWEQIDKRLEKLRVLSVKFLKSVICK